MSIFWIKMLAALSMLLDHTGLILFPSVTWLRIVGRLAFPLYALCIAEGFAHTRHRGKYFLRIFILGVICQIGYAVVSTDVYLGILLTFSLSIILMFFIDAWLCAIRGKNQVLTKIWYKLMGQKLRRRGSIVLCSVLLTLVLAATVTLTQLVTVDYGLTGVLFPVLVYLGAFRWPKFATFTLGVGLLMCNFEHSTLPRMWSALSLIPAALYNGKPGRRGLKYFFYVFYPAHLLILYGISYLLYKFG